MSRPLLFSGYCCCSSLASDRYPLPLGSSLRCFPRLPQLRLSAAPSKSLRLAGAHGLIDAHCSGTRTAEGAVLRLRSQMSAAFQ